MRAPFIQKISVSSNSQHIDHEQSPANDSLRIRSTSQIALAYFIARIPDLELPADREEARHVQQPLHRKILKELIPHYSEKVEKNHKSYPFICAQQIHGAEIAIVEPPFHEFIELKGIDGLITRHPDIILAVTVADCAPVWIVEKTGKVAAIIHSGKRGTEAGIVPKAIAQIKAAFSIDPSDLIVTIGPCIRPPCYEVDFAKTIRTQAVTAGVKEIRDEQICTACNLERYYSYRREQGKTGHMLATLQLNLKAP